MLRFTLIEYNKLKFERRSNEIGFQRSISEFHNGSIFFNYKVWKEITEALMFRRKCLSKQESSFRSRL
jgi:hypothetical protein